MKVAALVSGLDVLRLGLAAVTALGLAGALDRLFEPGGLGVPWVGPAAKPKPLGQWRFPSPVLRTGRSVLTLSLAGLVALTTHDPVAAVIALPALWGVVGLAGEWGRRRAAVEDARGAREMVTLLADAAAVHPNIYEALQSVRAAFPEPWRGEVETALGLLRATPGTTMAGQFLDMAKRTRSREVAILAKILLAAEEKGEVREQLARLDLLLQRHQALGERRRVRVAGHTFLIGLGLLAAPVGFLFMYLWARPWWTVDTTAPAGKVAVVLAILGETALWYLPRAFPPERGDGKCV